MENRLVDRAGEGEAGETEKGKRKRRIEGKRKKNETKGSRKGIS